MKILIETQAYLEEPIKSANDLVEIHGVNLEDTFKKSMIVLDKYTLIVKQLFEWRGVYINTIFSFLLTLKQHGQNLKNKWDSLYYLKLHTKLLERTKKFLWSGDFIVLVYEAHSNLTDYLETECIDYREVSSIKELTSIVNNNS